MKVTTQNIAKTISICQQKKQKRTYHQRQIPDFTEEGNKQITEDLNKWNTHQFPHRKERGLKRVGLLPPQKLLSLGQIHVIQA